MFKSDFQAVAEFFSEMRKNGKIPQNHKKFKHAQETLQLLSVMTHDHRYEDFCNDTEKGVPQNMCELYDRVENKGINIGENNILVLMQKLFAAGRDDDAKKASIDRAYCSKLMTEFGLSK